MYSKGREAVRLRSPECIKAINPAHRQFVNRNTSFTGQFVDQAVAFLYGMGLPEFREEFLFQHDPCYQVIISAAAIKA